MILYNILRVSVITADDIDLSLCKGAVMFPFLGDERVVIITADDFTLSPARRGVSPAGEEGVTFLHGKVTKRRLRGGLVTKPPSPFKILSPVCAASLRGVFLPV